MLSYSICSTLTRRTRCNVAGTFILQHRFQHQPPNRSINVQLLTDVQGLGKGGSIQSVAPGRMRSVLYPRRQAVYLRKDSTPRLPSMAAHENDVPISSQLEADLANMKSRLEAVVPLVFRRRLSVSAGLLPASTTQQAINGSITLHDIAQRLKEACNLSLQPPDAVLSFQERGLGEKIRMTGSFTILIHLRTGDVVPLTVLVEPETTLKDSKLPISKVA